MWKKRVQLCLQEGLGAGSQGSVFKALRIDRESGLKQTVAVKILHSKTAVATWKAEFESLAKVRSPYCVQVLSFERIRGRPALVLELVEGCSLSELGGAFLLDQSEREEILAQIHAGLIDLRAHQMSHGDLSPNNVIVDLSGRIRLLDFGLANGGGSLETDIRCTPNFAAPERLQGSPATFQSDLYSLGKIQLFLAGNPFGLGREASPLLYLMPELRNCPSFQHCPARQSLLARKVKDLKQRKELQAKMQTRLCTPPPDSFAAKHAGRSYDFKSNRLKCLLSNLSCLLILSSAPGSVRGPATQKGTAPAMLSIRTEKWHHFSIDGVEIGYAPVTVQLKADQGHSLVWRSATGQAGTKAISLSPGQWLVLADRDFTL